MAAAAALSSESSDRENTDQAHALGSSVDSSRLADGSSAPHDPTGNPSAQTDEETASLGGESEGLSSRSVVSLWFAAGLLLVILLAVLLARLGSKTDNSNEVSFQGLLTDHIIAKIKGRS